MFCTYIVLYPQVKEARWSTIRSTKNFQIWIFFITYELLFSNSKERTHIFYILNLVILLYFYIELSFLRRSIQSNNGHDHRTLLSIELLLKRKRFLRFFSLFTPMLKFIPIHYDPLYPLGIMIDQTWIKTTRGCFYTNYSFSAQLVFVKKNMHFYLLQY